MIPIGGVGGGDGEAKVGREGGGIYESKGGMVSWGYKGVGLDTG